MWRRLLWLHSRLTTAALRVTASYCIHLSLPPTTHSPPHHYPLVLFSLTRRFLSYLHKCMLHKRRASESRQFLQLIENVRSGQEELPKRQSKHSQRLMNSPSQASKDSPNRKTVSQKAADSPLLIACEENDTEAIQILLKYGAAISPDPSIRKRHLYRDPPLILALQNHNAEAVELLLKAGGDLGPDTLHLACQWPVPRAITLLLELGADPNQLSEDLEELPLDIACHFCNLEGVKLLLNAGADPNQTDGHRVSPLHVTAFEPGKLWARSEYWCPLPWEDACLINMEIAKLLLAFGADPNNVGNDGKQTPLHRACSSGNSKVLELLLKAGADVNRTDSSGSSPLKCACCWSSNVEVVKLLLEVGVDPNKQDSFGTTPLHCVCHKDMTKDDTDLCHGISSPTLPFISFFESGGTENAVGSWC